MADILILFAPQVLGAIYFGLWQKSALAGMFMLMALAVLSGGR